MLKGIMMALQLLTFIQNPNLKVKIGDACKPLSKNKDLKSDSAYSKHQGISDSEFCVRPMYK